VSTQIAIRLDDEELAALDAEVAEGRAASRSDAVRRSIGYLQRQRRYRSDEARLLELARRGDLVDPDLEAWVDLPPPPLD
jgi:Arc/MetJ-type ribon-helix-helix transcriptional regulator